MALDFDYVFSRVVVLYVTAEGLKASIDVADPLVTREYGISRTQTVDMGAATHAGAAQFAMAHLVQHSKPAQIPDEAQ